MFWFMLLMNLLIPLMMVFVGIYFKKAALSEINPLFGYRTRRSMASLEAWQFSNRLMGSDQEELVVLDRAGRLQIPKEYLEALGIRGGDKVRVELEDGKISVYNSDYNMHG